MKLKLNDLRRWDGEISRAPFMIWAALLFALKYNLDRLLLHAFFDRDWSALSYFQQPFPGFENLSPAQNSKELAVLLAASLPFLWFGVLLCIKRLRSARLPGWLAVLFVLPIVKWFLFVMLAIVPDRAEPGSGEVPASSAGSPAKPPARWLPDSAFGSAALAVTIAVLFAVIAAAISTNILHSYGWGLFVGVPFSMGFFAALIHGARRERSLGESLVVALLSVAIAGALLLALAFEGVICLLMAAPLAFPLALIGAMAGHAIQVVRHPRASSQIYCIPLLVLPLMLGTEAKRPEPPPLLKVATCVEVNAPVEVVWRHVIEFAELPPPHEFLFKTGIAYPIRAEIDGRGVGAVRRCQFSTGPFIEPVEVWDEPHLLKFSVTSNPAPLEEWTPYHEIHPPHLHGFLVSERGQFLLTPLPGGRTLLEGTTWYHHTMWPVDYWQLWSDRIIHTIHHRVLEHVKNLSEADMRQISRRDVKDVPH